MSINKITVEKIFAFLMVCFGVSALITGCDAVGPDIQNNPLLEPVAEYEIDTWGSNSEVYEFVPRGNPSYVCVMVMLDDSSDMGLQCFPKGK